MIQYHILFEIKIFQAFYGEYTNRDLEIIMPLAVRNNISAMSLLYKQTNEGFLILYREDKQHLLENLRSEYKLSFGIASKNRYFGNFSDLTSDLSKSKYFLENSSDSTHSQDESKHLRLHTNEFLDETSLSAYCVESSGMKAMLSDQEVTITQGEETYFEGVLEDWHNAINIFGNNYGRYIVTDQTSGESTPLNYIPEVMRRPFGIIDLSVGKESNRFEDVAGSVYDMKIDSRDVIWNYYFISNRKKQYESVTLYTGKKELPYSSPEAVKLINGQEALKLTSLEPFSLKKNFNQVMVAELEEQIIEENQMQEKKKINLPRPDITKIKGTKNDGKEVYFSDMYVYL